MECEHRGRALLNPDGQTLVLLGHQVNSSCALCLVETLCSDQLRISERTQFISLFLKTCEIDRKNINRNESLVYPLIKVATTLTELLTTDASSYANQLIEVITVIYENLPKESVSQNITLSPIMFWIQSANSSDNHKLNFIKLLTSHLKIFGTVTKTQSLKLIQLLVQSLTVNHVELSSWILFCIGQFMSSFLLESREILQETYTKIIEVIIGLKTSECVVNNGLGFIQILLNEQISSSLILTSQLSNLFRALLNTELEKIQSAVLDSFITNLEDNNGPFMNFVIHYGIVEFVFDLMNSNKKLWRRLHACLEIICENKKVLSTSLIPQAVQRLLVVINSLKASDRSLMFKYCHLLCICLQNYSGPVDFFLSSTVQEQYFELVLELVEDRDYTGFFMGRALLYHVFEHNRWIRPLPMPIILPILNGLSRAWDRYMNETHTEKLSKVENETYWEKLTSNCAMHFQLLFELIKLIPQFHADFSTIVEALTAKVAQLFFGQYLQTFEHIVFTDAPDLPIICAFCALTRIFLLGARQNVDSKQLFTVEASTLDLTCIMSMGHAIRTSFLYLLPLFYRILLRKTQLSRIKSLQLTNSMCSVNATAVKVQNPLSIKLDEHPADDKSTLAMLTVNSMAISNIQIRRRFVAMENLIEAEMANLHTLYRLVLRGISFVSDVDYNTLGELLAVNFNHVEYTSITVTALLIGCVLINRNIIFLEPEAKETNSDLQEYKSFPSVSERFMQRILSFVVHVGLEYFLELPALLTVELMLTLTVTKASVLSQMNPVVLGPKGLVTRVWLVLASALGGRLSPVHIYLLLRCPGFAWNLQNADVIWLRLAQSMISQCHSEEPLFQRGLFSLFQTSYPSLSNVLTVWMSTIIQGADIEVCRRLTNTLVRMLVKLQEFSDTYPVDFDEYQESRKNFAQYATECLSILPNKLSLSLVEFFGNNVEFRNLYISVLEHMIILLSQHSADFAALLKIIQQVMDVLARIDELPGRIQLRSRLSKVLLNCLISVKEHVFVHIIRTFFSSLAAPGLRHFYCNGDRSTECLQNHCSRHEIEPAELETVISLGVLVLGAEMLLRPTNFYDERLKGTLFTNPQFLLALIKNDLPGVRTDVTQVSSILCFLLAPDNVLWLSIGDDESSDFYCSLMLCLQSLIMDPVNQFLRFLAIKLFGLLLRKTSCHALEKESLGYTFLTNPWNGILVELLQAGVFVDPLPKLTIHYLELLIAFLSTDNPICLVWIEKYVLNKLMMVFVHHLSEYPAEIGNCVRVLVRILAFSSHLNVLGNADQFAVQVKLNSDPSFEPNPSLLSLFKLSLLEDVSFKWFKSA